MTKAFFNRSLVMNQRATFPNEGTVFYEPFASPDTTLGYFIRLIINASEEISAKDAKTLIEALSMQTAYNSGALSNVTTFDQRDDHLLRVLDDLIHLYNRKAGPENPNMRIMTGHPKERSVIFQDVKWT